ncbi:MAG: hypothetical protein ACREDK_06260 [Thermoplasmata archaeon]
MRTADTAARADHFLGVRLTAEEMERLDRFGRSRDLSHRSDAVRALVRAADGLVAGRPELPVGLQTRLEEIVEDGWARDLDGALTLVLTMGLAELSRVHTERAPALRNAARDGANRRAQRHRADRRGAGLLER